MAEGGHNGTEFNHEGYIEDPKIEKLLASKGREFLGKPVQFEEGRKPAKAITTYIGPSLVLNGRFVPPNDNPRRLTPSLSLRLQASK